RGWGEGVAMPEGAPRKSAVLPSSRNVPDNTREQLSSGFLAHQFQPGANWRGNALGRPKGSRNKLAEAFIADVYADWLEHGISTLVRVREKQPAAYLRAVAALLPQHIEVSDDVGSLSDDELDARLKLVEAALAECPGAQAGASGGAGRALAPPPNGVSSPIAAGTMTTVCVKAG